MFSIPIAILLQAAPVEPVTETVAVPQTEQLATEVEAEIAGSQVGETLPQSEQEEGSGDLVVAKGHKIFITIEGQVGSKMSKAKDFFPIKLAQAVEIDGVEVLPAGIAGEGQVVHAQKSGFGASAGELILAARYLEHGGRRIPLRSFKFIEEGDDLPFKGKDNSGVAIAATAVLLPLGFLIGGGNTTVEPGTLATAKFRADEAFAIVPSTNAEEGVPVEEHTDSEMSLEEAAGEVASENFSPNPADVGIENNSNDLR